MRAFLLVSIGLLVFSGISQAETIREHLKSDPDFQLYGVIFGVIQNEDGSIKEVRVANIVDATSDSKESVPIKLPVVYLEKADKWIRSHKYTLQKKDGKPVEFFTYFFYSPQLGDRFIDDADAPMSP